MVREGLLRVRTSPRSTCSTRRRRASRAARSLVKPRFVVCVPSLRRTTKRHRRPAAVRYEYTPEPEPPAPVDRDVGEVSEIASSNARAASSEAKRRARCRPSTSRHRTSQPVPLARTLKAPSDTRQMYARMYAVVT